MKRSNLGKKFLHPQKCALPYTYGMTPNKFWYWAVECVWWSM